MGDEGDGDDDDGQHALAETAGGTRNTLAVEVSGPLAPLLGLLIRRPIRKAIETENRGFKAAAEGEPVRAIA